MDRARGTDAGTAGSEASRAARRRRADRRWSGRHVAAVAVASGLVGALVGMPTIAGAASRAKEVLVQNATDAEAIPTRATGTTPVSGTVGLDPAANTVRLDPASVPPGAAAPQGVVALDEDFAIETNTAVEIFRIDTSDFGAIRVMIGPGSASVPGDCEAKIYGGGNIFLGSLEGSPDTGAATMLIEVPGPSLLVDVWPAADNPNSCSGHLVITGFTG